MLKNYLLNLQVGTKEEFERILPGLENMEKLSGFCSAAGNLFNQSGLKDHEKKVLNNILNDVPGCITKSGAPDVVKLHELKQQVKTNFNIDDKNI